MLNPLVSINKGTVDEIAKLHGVGYRLAKRIVRYRETHGYFRSPEDLAKIKGLSLNFAIALAPHIDWRIPPEAEQLVERDWDRALVLMIGIIASSIVFVSILSSIPLELDLGKNPKGGAAVWEACWGLASNVFLILGLIVRLAKYLTRYPAQRQKFSLISLLFFCLSLLSMFSVFLGTIYYQLHSTSGWRWIFVEPLPVVDAVFVLLVFSFLLGPALLVFCRPVWAYSPRLARSFDVGLVILGLLFVLSGWYKPNLGSVVVGGLVGLLLCYIGLDSLLTGKSSLEWYLRSFGLPSLVRLGNETAVWLAWLNARLPSPEQQRALQQALNKAYPRSRTRTFISLILVSIGSWLVLTFLSAIIQWIVQTWLNQLFKVVPH